jgi:hypothetical protein
MINPSTLYLRRRLRADSRKSPQRNPHTPPPEALYPAYSMDQFAVHRLMHEFSLIFSLGELLNPRNFLLPSAPGQIFADLIA